MQVYHKIKTQAETSHQVIIICMTEETTGATHLISLISNSTTWLWWWYVYSCGRLNQHTCRRHWALYWCIPIVLLNLLNNRGR